MTFLELCKRVRQDTGISGDGPASVTGQTGILDKIAVWVKTANNEIQLEKTDWRFLWRLGTGLTTAQKGEYFPADFGIVNLRAISSAHYGNAELTQKDWQWYMNNVLSANRQDEVGLSNYIIVRPDNKVLLWPTPSEQRTLTVNYYRTPVQINQNNDVPVLPEEYHEAIVCLALVKYGNSEEDNYLEQTKRMEYKQWINRISQTQSPQIGFA